jgi:hypothetical protein
MGFIGVIGRTIMIKKLFIATFLGLAAIALLAPFDPWVKQKAGDIFLSIFKNNFHCRVSGTVESFSVFPASLTMRDLTLTSSDSSHGAWQWKAKRYVTGFSWPHLIFAQTIFMWVELHDMHATSDMYEGNPAIIPHLQDLIRGPELGYPLTLKSVQIHQGNCKLAHEFANEFEWHGNFKKIDDHIRCQVYITDGSIAKKDQPNDYLVKNLTGSLSVDLPIKGPQEALVVNVEGRTDLPQLGSYATCFVTGGWRDGQAKFQVQSIDQQLRIYPLTIYQKDGNYVFQATAAIPLSYMSHLISANYPTITGNCITQLQGSLDPEGDLVAHFICDNFSHAFLVRNGLVKGHIEKKGMAITGSTELKSGAHEWKTTFSWDGSAHGQCHIENRSNLATSGLLWQIPKQSMTADITYDGAAKKIESNYRAIAKHTIKDHEVVIVGSCTLDDTNQLIWQGTCGDYHHALNASLTGNSCVQSCKLIDGRQRPVMACAYQDGAQSYDGTIDLIWLRNAISALFNIDLQAEGMLKYHASVQNSIIDGSIEMYDATIRLPQTLNFIERCHGRITCDLLERKITIRDLLCGFHSGSISIAQGNVWLDELGNLAFVHLPIELDHCLFTAKQDLFAAISGALLVEKRPQQDLMVRGNIVLDRSQLKENIFSPDIQKRLLSGSMNESHAIPALPIQTNIFIDTKDPIRVDTNFLQANAHLALHIQDSLTNPTIEGSCIISEGSIRFPYKPLFITKGEISFLKDQPFNPVVEIIAKNKIKHHQVALHVTGSLKEHMVLLDATPPLTEGQIVSLLVAGAHEESLQAILPTLLMQNVTNYIFSSHKSNFFERHIKPWMKRINVQLIPNFTQQSGRGGLRGALEVTINDSWRALIEKNFSLSEDTRFELEYKLSDDITFRLLRDERCDIGGEVEMKWKF